MKIKYKTFLLGATLPLLVGCRDTDDKFLVLDKADDKIIYQDMDTLKTTRVMVFEQDYISQEIYKFINPGDTITGTWLDTGLVLKNTFKSNFTATQQRIFRINNKSLITLRQEHARDSMINVIKKQNTR